jgi:flagellar hook assembly protein FlgD
VLRKVVIVVAVALVPAAPALAQTPDRSLLMPGVTYMRDVEFTPHGPVVMHVINAPKPGGGGLYSLVPLLSNEAILGRERVSDIERRVSSTMTTAGVNGDLFNFRDGHPSGMLLRNGVLDHGPLRDRSSVGLGDDGTLRVDRVALSGFWKGTGQRRSITLNELANANGISLFTPAWGPNTPGVEAVEAVLRPFPAAKPNTDLVGNVVQVGSTSGSTAIPSDGAVLQARGSAAGKLAAEAPLGSQLTIRLTLTPSWPDVQQALGGGPAIVRDGKPVFRANEAFSSAQLGPRNPRTAVGQRADGRILLVAVDGRQAGYSVGMTNFELALAMMRLGAVTASALDAGGSTTMAFDGQVLNQPSDPGGERAVAEALVVGYTGVYAPSPGVDVLSPNGDGVSETQTLAYKLVRASTVKATLVAPDKSVREIDSGERAPGIYRFTWPGANEPEGQWRFSVTATDDQGQTSTADRLFSVNETLGNLSVRPSSFRLGKQQLTGSVTLAHPAQLSVTVETATGVVLRVLARKAVKAGTFTFSWDGRNGARRLVSRGRMHVHVVATNTLGRAELYAPFTARR